LIIVVHEEWSVTCHLNNITAKNQQKVIELAAKTILVVELEQAKSAHDASMSKEDNIQNLPTKIRIARQPTCNQERSPVFLQTSKESSFSQ